MDKYEKKIHNDFNQFLNSRKRRRLLKKVVRILMWILLLVIWGLIFVTLRNYMYWRTGY